MELEQRDGPFPHSAHHGYDVEENFDLSELLEALEQRKDVRVHRMQYFFPEKGPMHEKVSGVIYVAGSKEGLAMRVQRTGPKRMMLTGHARDRKALVREFARIAKAIPEVKANEKAKEVEYHFWAHDQGNTVRKITTVDWKEIQGNYNELVVPELNDLITEFEPGKHGRLLLFHGVPGTGKTTAIRMLSWTWREWASFHYITDPESLFSSNGSYLLDVISEDYTIWEEDDEKDEDERWRVLVLEDCDELISRDAKEQTGQALSRMLNTLDGIMGQGFKVLILITTNEPLREAHPAVKRYGRCACEIDFKPLTEKEGNAWLKAHKSKERVDRAHTLADLYALLHGRPEQVQKRQKIGFN
jgi:SpoVK/Ycf46/Vps4 family AAA+-type ATPase